jgi:predicted nucleic acid-binding protein
LIDTSAFIELERRNLPMRVLAADAENETFAIASITASELLFGVERAATPERRRRRSDFVEAVLDALPVLPFDVSVARVHARIWAGLEGAGRRIGPHDLLIASTALAHGCALVTFNVREFERVPGLAIHRPSW